MEPDLTAVILDLADLLPDLDRRRLRHHLDHVRIHPSGLPERHQRLTLAARDLHELAQHHLSDPITAPA